MDFPGDAEGTLGHICHEYECKSQAAPPGKDLAMASKRENAFSELLIPLLGICSEKDTPEIHYSLLLIAKYGNT